MLSLEPLVFLREHAYGACYAFPVADPMQRSRGGTEEQALEEQRFFLSRFLAKCPAGRIADYIFPEDATLLDLPVVLPRADLPRRLRMSSAVAVPCVVVPQGRAHWVHVIGLRHAVFVRPTEDLSRRVTAEIERMAAAQHLDASEYLRLLPTPRHRLVRLPIEVERDDASDASRRASSRRKERDEQTRKKARELLEGLGTELLNRHRRHDQQPPVVERDHEIQTLASLLDGTERMSVMLVGEPLSGKSAIVEGLMSQKVVRFASRPVYATSGAQLVAGQSGFGQLEQRVDAVMAAAELIDAVLYFDDLADLFAGTSGGIEDIAAMMRPWIVDGRVRVVGELTPEVLGHHAKRHVAFFAALQRIHVVPLDAEATRTIVRARVLHQARVDQRRPRLSPACVEPLVELCRRYLSYQAFPGKAVLFAEELRAVHDGELEEDGEPRIIREHDVHHAFSVRSGIPMFLLRDEQSMRYEEVLQFFSRQVIGQREAVERLAQTLCTVKAGLQPPGKPLANLLFVGPTGVGKTEVAKTLARFLFGGTDKMVRFDMSEYGDPYAAERLIRGTQREEGELTRRVRQRPFSVVLLDEIEKAHPAVFDLLLQVLGEGRLSDARGRTTWFHNCIVIMTSNLGASHRRPRSGFAGDEQAAEDAQQHYVDKVDRHFRPEFVNRLDRVVPFVPLSADEIAQVAKVALRGLLEREGLAARGVDFGVSDAALARLAQGGHSDAYGARALRRHLEDHLVAPLARVLARAGSEAESGAVRVFVTEDEGPDAAGPISERGVEQMLDEDGLSFALYRRLARDERRSAGDVRAIAGLRRMASECRQLEPIVELRDRVDYLVAELARSKNRAKSQAAQAAEHARLDACVRALDEAVEMLEGAEDLAMVAQTGGESAAPYFEEAREAFIAFERAFVQAILGTHGVGEISLLVRAHGDCMRLTRWLLSLLEQVDERGWWVRVHRWEDPKKEAPWPETLPWGPPREAGWVRETIEGSDEGTIFKEWRGVIVRVRGSMAGSLLYFERGLHRFMPEGEEEKEPEHLEVEVRGASIELSHKQLASTKFALGKPRTRAVLSKEVAVREYDPDALRVSAPKADQRFSMEMSDYWENHERIVFSVLADALVRGEDVIGEAGTWS